MNRSIVVVYFIKIYMQCPLDNITCNHSLLGTVWIDTCPRCQGVWLEDTELPKLIFHFSFPFLQTDDDLLKAWQAVAGDGLTPARDFWQETKLGCPHGHGLMKKHYLLGTQIGVDHCVVCRGFWLEGAELKAVYAQAVPDPKQDAIGRFVAQTGNDFLRDAKKINRLHQKVLYAAVSSLTNPRYLLYILGTLVFQTLLDAQQLRVSVDAYRADVKNAQSRNASME